MIFVYLIIILLALAVNALLAAAIIAMVIPDDH